MRERDEIEVILKCLLWTVFVMLMVGASTTLLGWAFLSIVLPNVGVVTP